VDSTSCDDTLMPARPGGVTAVKIAVLAESDADLHGLLEPLSERPIMTVRVGQDDDFRFDAPVPVRFARLDLAPDLTLYLFGALRPAPPTVLNELLSGAVGVVLAGPTRTDGLDLRGLPAVHAPVHGSVLRPHLVVDRGGRGRAKHPFTTLVQQAIARRRTPYTCGSYPSRPMRLR
jgi:hypothetical protein